MAGLASSPKNKDHGSLGPSLTVKVSEKLVPSASGGNLSGNAADRMGRTLSEASPKHPGSLRRTTKVLQNPGQVCLNSSQVHWSKPQIQTQAETGCNSRMTQVGVDYHAKDCRGGRSDQRPMALNTYEVLSDILMAQTTYDSLLKMS